MNLDKHYQPAAFETQIYQLWEKNHCFNPDNQSLLATDQSNSTTTSKKNQPKTQPTKNRLKRSFTIIMPPPNANDPLHIGHAVFVALEDVLIRFHRLIGDDTLWLPGTDHAGIETQYVYEKKLAKQKKSRFDFDRQTLYQQIWDYVQENSDTAVNQIKRLGASADWSRFRFTLDPQIVNRVIETFQKLHEEGLIYRANRLINYCPKCGTGFSELEVNHQPQTSKLYYLKYGPLTVATTRPETKFADLALAVHPSDQRYQSYIGQTITAQDQVKTYQLPVIADEFVDPEFGTGVVKITPLHDHHDFAFWQKHQAQLPTPELVINHRGRLTALAGQYQGLKAIAARDQIVADLQQAGVVVKIDDHYQNTIGVCYRCGQPLEPLPLTQFYVKVKPLTKPVLEGLTNKKINVIGAGYDKILQHWLEILEDWNISRQIVWGIRLPVWYEVSQNPDLQITFLNDDHQPITGLIGELLTQYSLDSIKNGLQTLTAPLSAHYEVAKTAPGENYLQETDTFDTWFSSSQWPVLTLQTNQPTDLKRFYPTQVLETAYDILMFWVMRMLMMGHFLTGQFPFSTVYLHGLIRDEKGRKMSKSKGNVINPLEIADQYGADALRLALIIRSTPGLDKSVSPTDFKAARNFINKVWNAARFVLAANQAGSITSAATPVSDLAKNSDLDSASDLTDFAADQAVIKHTDQLITAITRQLEHYQIGLATDTIHQEFWHWFCDQVIEQAKQHQVSLITLTTIFLTLLKLLHPIIPFVTEAIWQTAYEQQLTTEKLLITAAWPVVTKSTKSAKN